MSGNTKKIAETAARIFGNYLNPSGLPTGRKLLRKHLIGEKLAAYYPEKGPETMDPLFEDPLDKR